MTQFTANPGKIDDFPEMFTQSGSVDIYNLSDMTIKTTISGDREISRHGQTILVSSPFLYKKFVSYNIQLEDINNDGISDLFISSPLRTDDYDFIEKGSKSFA